MKVWLEDNNWELSLEDDKISEYDNYVRGFVPFLYKGFVIDTVRVLISIHKEKKSVSILLFPWNDGDTYTNGSELIPSDIRLCIKSLVEGTNFYRRIFEICARKFNDGVVLVN